MKLLSSWKIMTKGKNPMTRLPSVKFALADCSAALRLLEENDDPRIRRALYFGIVGILRTIGDLLGKHGSLHERDTFSRLKEIWNRENEEHSIFLFIVRERNLLVHEYQHGHADEHFSPLAVGNVGYNLGTDIYWPLEYGPFAGADVRDALAECIQWWTSQLIHFEN